LGKETYHKGLKVLKWRGWSLLQLLSVTFFFGEVTLQFWGGSREVWLVWPSPLNKKMRHYNTLTYPQNAGKLISGDLNFKNFLGDASPTSQQGNTIGGLHLKLPSLKFYICPAVDFRITRKRRLMTMTLLDRIYK